MTTRKSTEAKPEKDKLTPTPLALMAHIIRDYGEQQCERDPLLVGVLLLLGNQPPAALSDQNGVKAEGGTNGQKSLGAAKESVIQAAKDWASLRGNGSPQRLRAEVEALLKLEGGR